MWSCGCVPVPIRGWDARMRGWAVGAKGIRDRGRGEFVVGAGPQSVKSSGNDWTNTKSGTGSASAGSNAGVWCDEPLRFGEHDSFWA